ncbi:hypothetical protein LX81_01243 [Palleronia aestuarii]|uniref:Uncharacterized protein n=1 Tax=Palleronia aestuarii TaxID=568105 RepID=A0A2W7NBK4_9RHOB|nr:hypothetical protein [Palleronia aestuarii]PZX17518.1 hypothetical protein LX81_01243 [Palleronia aestuarii]
MHIGKFHEGDWEHDILDQVLEDFEKRSASLPSETRSRVGLVLASRLCEKVAFANAGEWEAVSVADLLLLSAQVERFAMKDRKLD